MLLMRAFTKLGFLPVSEIETAFNMLVARMRAQFEYGLFSDAVVSGFDGSLTWSVSLPI